jgi:hypothetical protein
MGGEMYCEKCKEDNEHYDAVPPSPSDLALQDEFHERLIG